MLHLATLRPTQAEPVWSAIATGRYPMSNGVRSAVVYRVLGGTPIQLLPDYCFTQALVTFGFLSEEPQTASDLLARPIWNILSDRGASVGVIGWPLTQPAPVVNGFVVSDAFHRLTEAELSLDSTRRRSGRPIARWTTCCAALQTPADPDPVSLVSAMGAPQPVNDYDAAQRPGADRRRSRAPAAAERARQRRRRDCWPSVFPASTPSGHRFLRYADPVGIWRRVGSRARAVRRRA